MKEEKPKYCKCGHILDSHREKKKFLGITNTIAVKCKGKCKTEMEGINKDGEQVKVTVNLNCDCKRFTRRNYPTKFEKGLNYFVLGAVLFMVGGLFFLSYTGDQLLNSCTNEACHKILNEKIFTYKQAIKGIDLFFILLGVFMSVYLLLPTVSENTIAFGSNDPHGYCHRCAEILNQLESEKDKKK